MQGHHSDPLIEVSIPFRVPLPFHYTVPKKLEKHIQKGMAVRVPLGHKEVTGFVVGFPQQTHVKALKAVHAVLGATPLFNDDLLKLFSWVSSYYCAPLGQVLKTFLPSVGKPHLLQNPCFALNVDAETDTKDPSFLKKGSPQADLFNFFAQSKLPLFLNDIQARHFSTSTLKALIRKGLLKELNPLDIKETPKAPPLPLSPLGKKTDPNLSQDHHTPSLAQQTAIETISKEIFKRNFKPFLLEGVTGSGKTEVYIHAIRKALENGRDALFLVPEIALTAQLIERLRLRLNEPVAILHSALSPKERHKAWIEIQEGKFRVALGVRSAVFAPFRNLGLVIIDEEHDPSYKQGEGLRYHARDVALVRAKHSHSVVILGSATPSLESYYNSHSKKYSHLHLRYRIDHRPLPQFEIIDLREHPSDDALLSPPLLKGIKERLESGEQVLLFLNRRGFRPSLLCRDCGYTLRCPNCSVSLILYKKGTVLCHYCDFETHPPEHCPECQGIRWGGIRGGTERLEEEVKHHFPDARVLRMDRDTTRKKNAHGSILDRMVNRQCDILIGTQMIAKGHDLPGITLVGIVLADVGLTLPDFRASERLFQVITQVAGRCGRGDQPGEVMIQTFNPEETTLSFAANYNLELFYERELSHRKKADFPPYCRLALLLIQGNNEQKVLKAADRLNTIAKKLKHIPRKKGMKQIEVLGPVPAPIGKLRGKFRFQLLLKGKTVGDIQHFLKNLLNETRGNQIFPGTELFVDVDPQAFL